MANDWYTADNAHVLKALKMSTFGNSNAKLTSSDVQAYDELIACKLVEPIGLVSPISTGASFLPKFKTTSWLPGTWDEILFFQTAMNLYPALGVCSTTEATPNVHVITLRTGLDPVNQARHFERENVTDAESERLDLFRMTLQHLHMECSEASPIALQHNKWGCAYTKTTSTDDITRSEVTDEPFKWHHFTFPTFTYNSETIEADIIGWAFDAINTIHYYSLDSDKRYASAKYIPLTYLMTTLEIIPYGRNAFELMRTDLEDYTADPNNLNLTVKCARNATTDYVQWTHDDLYCRPVTISVEKSPGRSEERYLLIMSQLSTGSLTIEAKDQYNKSYFEVS